MAKVKPGWAEKWVSRASVATDAYKTGVQNPRVDWSTATVASAGNWKIAIQEAITAKRYENGVTKAGSQKWQQGALTKGADRFASGVAAAKDNYTAKMTKVIAVIERTALPVRMKKGDPANYSRVQAMGQALNAAKKAGEFL